MRRHIITQREKEAIHTFLEDGKRIGIIRTLLYRSRRYLPELKEEISLLEKLLEKANTVQKD